jgi:hypothetical protein
MRRCFYLVVCLVISLSVNSLAQGQQTSSSSRHHRSSERGSFDAGSAKDGVYRNVTFGFSCKIPDGWVLRTEEMNGDSRAAEGDCPHACSTVLLAAFSRPPEAKGEAVNSSILIAAESAATYPGLKEAVQYFGPLTEVAKAQGFEADGDPYEIAIGTKTLVRGDFQKDVGTRVMRQSTLVMLSHGYAVSMTFIAGTEDDVEELVDGLDFAGAAKVKK